MYNCLKKAYLRLVGTIKLLAIGVVWKCKKK